eukprot:4640825-Pleurochrysis_carterae.AAC.2
MITSLIILRSLESSVCRAEMKRARGSSSRRGRRRALAASPRSATCCAPLARARAHDRPPHPRRRRVATAAAPTLDNDRVDCGDGGRGRGARTYQTTSSAQLHLRETRPRSRPWAECRPRLAAWWRQPPALTMTTQPSFWDADRAAAGLG